MSFSTIFILLFVAVGLGIAAFGARGVIHARASSAWPQISGEIMHSEITDSDSSYSPLVRYKYSVSDRAFAGERICFGLDRMFAGYKFAQRYTRECFPSRRADDDFLALKKHFDRRRTRRFWRYAGCHSHNPDQDCTIPSIDVRITQPMPTSYPASRSPVLS